MPKKKTRRTRGPCKSETFRLGADTVAALDQVAAWMERQGVDARPGAPPRAAGGKPYRPGPAGASRADAIRYSVSIVLERLRGQGAA